MRATSGNLRERVERIARAVVDRKTGLFGGLQTIPSGPDVHQGHVAAKMADYSVLPGGGKILGTGGTGHHLDTAVTCAVFESIERYCGAFVDRSRLTLARPNCNVFLYGDRLPLFADEQYASPQWPFVRLTEDSEVYWAEARSLATSRPAFIPAILVYVPYRASGPRECLGPSTSTGMACAPSRTEACLTGLLEVAERDAFTIMWLNRLSFPRVRPAKGGALDRHLRARLAGLDVRVTFVDATNDFRLPVAIAYVETSHRGRPLVSLGASCKPTFEAAASKALDEALKESTRLRTVLDRPGEPWRPSPSFDNVIDFEWHSLAYTDPEMHQELKFIVASPEERPVEDTAGLHGAPEEILCESLSRVMASGEEPFVVDLTTREVRDLDLHVVKVVVPRAVPLSPDHRYQLLGSPRLLEVPHKLGLAPAPRRREDLNLRVPHPFA